jgi:hypothetical protein
MHHWMGLKIHVDIDTRKPWPGDFADQEESSSPRIAMIPVDLKHRPWCEQTHRCGAIAATRLISTHSLLRMQMRMVIINLDFARQSQTNQT